LNPRADTCNPTTPSARAEARLTAAALQAAIVDSASFSSIATDARGVIQLFNVGAERMFGYTATEVVDRMTPAELSCPEELVARAAALSREFALPIRHGFPALVFKAARGLEDIYELTKIRKDGTRFPAVVSVTALRGPDDAIIGYLLIGTDNTPRHKAQEERTRLQLTLQQKNAELEAANRTKSEFLASMSHELRTPLNAILGFSGVLRDGLVGELTEQQRALVGDIVSRGQHLLSLVNDILDLSAVEEGAMRLALAPVPVAAILADALVAAKDLTARRDVDLTVDLPDQPIVLVADPHRVAQIVDNLLSNALKFTREGGRVSLRARAVPRAAVGQVSRVWASRTSALVESDFDEFLELSVTDRGIGMSPAGLAQLFEPFRQIDGGLTRRFPGAGLGLVMVKSLAELHLGSVGVESAEGEGSRFVVWLPLRSVDVVPEPEPSSPLWDDEPRSTDRPLRLEEPRDAAPGARVA
jgi:signal transduction histidine kinase